MTVESDGSVFVSGPNPERAVYTLKGRIDLPAISAIRLETIPDPRLPQGGAGRYPTNGNFHVSEFTAALESDGKNSEPAPIDISSATRDFSVNELHAPRNMIDGNPRTRWDTENGDPMHRAHWAVFGLKSPVPAAGGYLSITLDSGITSWGHHGLGRFRLSVTNEEEATRHTPLRHDFGEPDLAELNLAIGKAYVQQGQASEAARCSPRRSVWPRTAAPKPGSSRQPRRCKTCFSNWPRQPRAMRSSRPSSPGVRRIRQCTLGECSPNQSPGTAQTQAGERAPELGTGGRACRTAARRARERELRCLDSAKAD